MLMLSPLLLLLPALVVGHSPSTGVRAKHASRRESSKDIVATTWYAGWHAKDFPLAEVSWSKFTAVTYAFGITTPDSSVISLEDSDKKLLPQFVHAAHQNNVKALLSIGGWTGSQYFSTAVATSANRTKFTKAVLGLVSKYDLDGIDFDWEYPNSQGIGCNTVSAHDSANFLSLLQELRSTPSGKHLTLSAAVSITPFAGSDGKPMSDVSQFAKVLDWIAIMNYDIWGSWSDSVGPNAPLNDTCASGSAQQGSAVSAVAAWSAAKFPVNQIVLGVASYGHSFFVDRTTALQSGNLVAHPSFEKSKQPKGDSWDDTAGVDQCGNAAGIGGNFDFWGLIKAGFLNKKGKVEKGISYRYDSCSQTPYVYNPTSQVMVSYDDARSFAAKGKFIKSSGLGGFAMWEAGGDYQNILVNSIRKATGLDVGTCHRAARRQEL